MIVNHRRDARTAGRAIVRRAAPLVCVALVSCLGACASDHVAGTPSSSVSAQTQTTSTGRPELQHKVDAVLFPFAGSIEAILRSRQDWLQGVLADADYATQLNGRLPDLASTRDEVRRVDGTADPRALILYCRATDLYLELVRVDVATTTLPSGDLRHEAQLLGGRLRVLADRLYDRAHELLVGADMSSGGIEIRRPDEVPSWPEEHLAPGPPLAPPAIVLAAPPGLSVERPEQPVAAWEAMVAAASIPNGVDHARALDDGVATDLAQLADAFVNAEDVLRRSPDPAGQRSRNTVVRLTLLVDADSARAAQIARLLTTTSATAFVGVARRLAVIGDLLWDPGLPPRSTGLPVSLLD